MAALIIFRDALIGLIVMGTVFSILLTLQINSGSFSSETERTGKDVPHALMNLRHRDQKLRRDSLLQIDSAYQKYPREFKTWITPTPSNIPRLPEIIHLRNCECTFESGKRVGPGIETMAWMEADEKASCSCNGNQCPDNVNARFISDAKGQGLCSRIKPTGFDCTLECKPDGLYWYAHKCGVENSKECPPLAISPSPTPGPTDPPTTPTRRPHFTYNRDEVVDLRNLKCELLNGEERCFMETTQGRTLCPAYVTSEYLNNPPDSGPYAVSEEIRNYCSDEYKNQFFCTVYCQDKNDVVRWYTQSLSWCYGEGREVCPSQRPVIPKDEFKVQLWSEQRRPLTPCQLAKKRGYKPNIIQNLTVGMLTHEPRAIKISLATYEEHGLFDVIPEFILFINKRNQEIEKIVEPYVKKYGRKKFRVLGSRENLGINGGIIALTEAASYNYFLFLERDFLLIEPNTCVVEQLEAGIKLLETGDVHVVRYRHRYEAGFPNWAELFYYGKEDLAFIGRQPNLGCNVHYWVWDTAERWPQYFQRCGTDPEMICTDSYYCNWTNNPQLWRIDWWNKEYVERFSKWERQDPFDDLEAYMNWEPNAWNERQFVVAQGDGLFKHVDHTKF